MRKRAAGQEVNEEEDDEGEGGSTPIRFKNTLLAEADKVWKTEGTFANRADFIRHCIRLGIDKFRHEQAERARPSMPSKEGQFAGDLARDLHRRGKKRN